MLEKEETFKFINFFPKEWKKGAKLTQIKQNEGSNKEQKSIK